MQLLKSLILIGFILINNQTFNMEKPTPSVMLGYKKIDLIAKAMSENRNSCIAKRHEAVIFYYDIKDRVRRCYTTEPRRYTSAPINVSRLDIDKYFVFYSAFTEKEVIFLKNNLGIKRKNIF